jgi:hypothetical protein
MKMARGTRHLIAALFAFAPLWPGSGGAQSPIFALADSSAKRRAGGDVLARTISLRLTNVPLEQALRAVAAQGGTRLAYASDLLPPDVRVTIVRERISLGDAFREALRETDLDIVATPSGYIVIVRSMWPKARPALDSVRRCAPHDHRSWTACW